VDILGISGQGESQKTDVGNNIVQNVGFYIRIKIKMEINVIKEKEKSFSNGEMSGKLQERTRILKLIELRLIVLRQYEDLGSVRVVVRELEDLEKQIINALHDLNEKEKGE